MRSVIHRYPTSPTAPALEGQIPFRSWVRTADDAAIVRYNATLPSDEPPARPVEEALTAADRWDPEADDASLVALELLTHPDERVPITLLTAQITLDQAERHFALIDAVIEQRDAHAADAGEVLGRRCTPLNETYTTWLTRHGHWSGQRLSQGLVARVACRVGAIDGRGLDRHLGNTNRAIGYVADAASVYGGPSEDLLCAALSLARLAVVLHAGHFATASARVIGDLVAYGRHHLRQVAPTLLSRAARHVPPAGDAAMATLRAGLLDLLRDEIAHVRAGHAPELPEGAPYLLTYFNRRPGALTAAELHQALGGLTALEVDDRQPPAPGVFQPALAPAAVPNPHLVAYLDRLTHAVTDVMDEDFETLLLAGRSSQGVLSLIQRARLTPRMAHAVLRVSAEPVLRGILARNPDVRHDPVVDRRLLASRSSLVMEIYLMHVAPARFAYAFTRYIHVDPKTALTCAARRWEQIHDFMDPSDLVGFPTDDLPDMPGAILHLLREDLRARTLGAVPGPLDLPPQLAQHRRLW